MENDFKDTGDKEYYKYKLLSERIASAQKHFDLEIKNFKDLYESEKKAMKEALALQAKEYERRLADLNHEAARLQKMKEELVQIVKYEAEVGPMKEWQSKQQGKGEGAWKSVYLIIAVVSLLIALATVIIMIVQKK